MAKVKIVKKTFDNDTATMFNQMIGTDLNLEYAWPRYNRLKIIAKQIVKLVSIIDSIKSSEAVSSWLINRNADIDLLFSIKKLDMKPAVPGLIDYETVPIAQREEFKKSYDACKKFPLFKLAISWNKHLSNFAATLNTDYDTLKPGQPKPHLTLSNTGNDWYPLEPLKINFKSLLSSDDEKISKIVVGVLRKLLSITDNLIRELNTPDVDVDGLVDAIMSSINKLRHIPELSRCTSALSHIKKSVSLLKENFAVYYKDFIETSDSTIIVQHFILDVSKDAQVDAKTAMEFKKIIEYYRKASKEHGKDKKLSKLFDKLDESIAKLEESVAKPE